MWDTGTRAAEPRGRIVVVTVAVMAVLIVLQVSVIAALRLPLGSPDIVLVVLCFVALCQGPVTGAVVGFSVGVLADLLSTHVLGQTALVFSLVGYGVGLVGEETDRSAYLPLAVAAAASATATAGHAAMAGIIGQPSLTGTQTLLRALGAALYALVLTPVVFPLVTAGLRRLRREQL
ncbi:MULTISPECIES: rod shape-determining protein MreD [Protofrankia]|uniref:Rod shape-determining protein MreD n=1 Tax=Candidatus Protofrankia datiscae TaxID=2716812 RepID=F8B3F0_9ACTN|nr:MULTISPECIES: rod shape-determining protein MreD [Protofrankia]AEH08986.1 rod shape-determining protein MreD [Candidatus Protofrankia datiscae]